MSATSLRTVDASIDIAYTIKVINPNLGEGLIPPLPISPVGFTLITQKRYKL